MNQRVIISIIIVLIVLGGIIIVSTNRTIAPKNTAPTIQSQSSNNNTVTPTASMAPTSGNPTVTTPTTASTSPSMTMKATTNTVTLTTTGFSPATVTIKAGEKVTWVNKSGGAATVNSDPHPTHTNYPPLNLGQFPDGTESLSLIFDKPGTYGYHNHFDPGQKGTVIVK